MFKFPKNQLIFSLILAGFFLQILTPRLLLAEKYKDSFPPTPLEISPSDPLIPDAVLKGQRPISPLELFRLKPALDRLNNNAMDRLNAGAPEEAFEIWYREIRLRRILGVLEEINALGRVGEIAWQETRKTDTQIITKRLVEIQQEAETNGEMNLELMIALGEAYQKVRNPQRALVIYQNQLLIAKAKGDLKEQETILRIMGQLHLAWFDYPNAAKTYEELLFMARSQLNTVNETFYLQQLAYIYKQSIQPENALRIKQEILQSYLETQQLALIPKIKIEIGGDYEALGELEKASQEYQEAFGLAWSLGQMSVSGDALQKLGDLYLANDHDEYALKIYQELLKIKQQAYDFYGLMNTYNQIGKIYLENQNYPQALIAFEQGLVLAQSLSYQVEYFANQINEVNQKIIP
jgi:tetratricopeptide (TPR) repeat protein